MDKDVTLAWATEELVRLVEIPSVSGDEAEVLAYLEQRVDELGFDLTRIPTPNGHDNLLIGSPNPQLLLTAHVDTIEPTWRPSERSSVQDGTVAGVGAVDDKSGVVVCLLSLMLARERGVSLEDVPVAVALTVDEEIGGTGSAAVAEAVCPPYVVAVEGTNLGLATAESGAVEGQVTVLGRSVHGALVEEGDNAIVKAAHLILKLSDLPFTRLRHPLVGHSLPSVEKIQGGSDLWVIPDRVSMRLEVRISPGVSAEDVVSQVSALCDEHDATYEVGEVSVPFELPAESLLRSVFEQAGEEALGRALVETGMPSWTDAHNFVDIARSEAVVFGPGSLKQAHHPDERIEIQEVVQAADVLAAVVGRWPRDERSKQLVGEIL